MLVIILYENNMNTLLPCQDLNKMCRTCLCEHGNFVDIFTVKQDLGGLVIDAIITCAAVNVTMHEGLPTMLCKACYDKLEAAYQFQALVQDSEKTFVQYIKTLHTTVKQCSCQSKCLNSLSKTGSESPVCNEASHDHQSVKFEKIPSSYETTKFQNATATGNKINDKANKLDDHIMTRPNEFQKIVKEEITGMEFIDVPIIDEEYIKIESDDGENVKIESDDGENVTKSDRNVQKLVNFDNNRKLKKRKNSNVHFYQCDVCMKYIKNLKVHKLRHVGEKPLTKLITVVEQTKEQKPTVTDKTYKCNTCSKSFTDSVIFNKHKQSHSIAKSYQCKFCSKLFSETCRLAVHERAHKGETLECDVCKKKFTHIGSLREHKLYHANVRNFLCDACGKSYIRRSELNLHKKSSHADRKRERLYPCHVCKKRFVSASQLKVHSRLHTGEKPYRCSVCNKRFTQLSHLNSHKLVHADDKPFCCTVCDKHFVRPGDLVVHKRMHTGEKPYRCNVCDASFSTSSNMTKHKRIHSGEKNYQCDACAYRCSDSSTLNKHRRRVHKKHS